MGLLSKFMPSPRQVLGQQQEDEEDKTPNEGVGLATSQDYVQAGVDAVKGNMPGAVTEQTPLQMSDKDNGVVDKVAAEIPGVNTQGTVATQGTMPDGNASGTVATQGAMAGTHEGVEDAEKGYPFVNADGTFSQEKADVKSDGDLAQTDDDTEAGSATNDEIGDIANDEIEDSSLTPDDDDTVDEEGEDPRVKYGSFSDMMDEMESIRKEAEKKAEASYRRSNAEPVNEEDPEVKYAGMTPEQRAKAERRDKRLKTWSFISDIFKDLANTFAVTQGVATHNWGINSNEREESRKQKIIDDYKEKMLKYTNELQKIKDAAGKDAVTQYINARRQAETERRNKKAEEDRAKAASDKEAKDAEKEAAAKKDREMRAVTQLVKNGVRDLNDLDEYDSIPDHVKMQLIQKANEDDRLNRVSKTKNTSSKTSKVKWRFKGADGKTYEYGGTEIDLKDAYDEVVRQAKAEGGHLKEIEKNPQKMIRAIKDWILDHPVAATNSGQSLRDRYLAKLRGVGGRAEDWT